MHKHVAIRSLTLLCDHSRSKARLIAITRKQT